MLKFVTHMVTNMPKIYLTLLLVLSVLSSAAQDNEKKTFKALGTDWRVFSIEGRIGGANNREAYKLDARNYNSILSTPDYELVTMKNGSDSGVSYDTYVNKNLALYFNVIFRPIVMSNKKLLQRQEVRIGLGYQKQEYQNGYKWITQVEPDKYVENSDFFYFEHQSFYFDPSWLLKTPNLGWDMVLYSGLGFRFAIAGKDNVKEHFSETVFIYDNGYYKEIPGYSGYSKYHNLKPRTTLMYYLPLGLKKYISCRVNAVAEAYYGRGTTYIKGGGNWNFESSGFQVGLQYKFQNPSDLGEKNNNPDKIGVFW